MTQSVDTAQRAAAAALTPLELPAFRPLEDRLVVRPDKVKRFIGSIALPDEAIARMERENKWGTVLRVGPGMTCKDGRRWPMPDVVPGDRIVYDSQGAVRILVHGELLHSVREDFVHAVSELDHGETRCAHQKPACADCIAHDTLCANST